MNIQDFDLAKILLILWLFLIGSGITCFCYLVSIYIHEFGHYFQAIRSGLKVIEVQICPCKNQKYNLKLEKFTFGFSILPTSHAYVFTNLEEYKGTEIIKNEGTKLALAGLKENLKLLSKSLIFLLILCLSAYFLSKIDYSMSLVVLILFILPLFIIWLFNSAIYLGNRIPYKGSDGMNFRDRKKGIIKKRFYLLRKIKYIDQSNYTLTTDNTKTKGEFLSRNDIGTHGFFRISGDTFWYVVEDNKVQMNKEYYSIKSLIKKYGYIK